MLICQPIFRQWVWFVSATDLFMVSLWIIFFELSIFALVNFIFTCTNGVKIVPKKHFKLHQPIDKNFSAGLEIQIMKN